MTGRKCSTCKHYEPAPIWRKGWCRNPMLFSPQQSHLVGEDDLDCERGMGNYWEPGEAVLSSERNSDVFPLTIYPPRDGVQAAPVASDATGLPVYSVSGSSGYNSDDLDDDLPPPENPSRITTPSGRDRSLTYYAEERYWTDYLRIAAPILGVILFLILAWFWVSSFLGDDDDNGTVGDASGSPTSAATFPIIGASPTASTQTGAQGTAQLIITATVGSTAPTGAVATNTPEAPVTGGEIYPGATVQVANTGVEGVNLRAEATTSSAVVAVLIDGTQLTTTGNAVESEGFIWWPVQGEAGAGYIVVDYLTLIQ